MCVCLRNTKQHLPCTCKPHKANSPASKSTTTPKAFFFFFTICLICMRCDMAVFTLIDLMRFFKMEVKYSRSSGVNQSVVG
ncbi:hypothetical protein AB205_0106560 [Aquarana catesbeiana]|uniref:Uncharacterized protein n=1 Tax=Aquarana catesbeiana TaxID=8400 RepID=A0A2G9SEU6_AQUCT|nr:hypothetical protein AB205_0106560 [Aquarana catesbeiana]